MALGWLNGFSVEPYGSPLLATYRCPGTQVRVSLRKETAPLFLGLMADFNTQVEALNPSSVWGHAPRAIRGTTNTWSFHAPGIAVDLNADRHPLGRVGTFGGAQFSAIRRILGKYRYAGQPLFRWGGDYLGRKDEMHVELIVPRAVAIGAVGALQQPPPAPGAFPLPAGHWYGPDARHETAEAHNGDLPGDRPVIARIQRKIGVTADGFYGPMTAGAAQRYQQGRRLVADGLVGPKTWAALRP